MLLYIATIGEFGLNSTTDGSPAVCTLSTGATGFLLVSCTVKIAERGKSPDRSRQLIPSLARGLSGRAIMLLAVYGDEVGIIIGTAFGIGTILGAAFGTAIFAGDGVAELLEYTDSELISSSSSVGTKSWLLAP